MAKVCERCEQKTTYQNEFCPRCGWKIGEEFNCCKIKHLEKLTTKRIEETKEQIKELEKKLIFYKKERAKNRKYECEGCQHQYYYDELNWIHTERLVAKCKNCNMIRHFTWVGKYAKFS